MEGAWRRPHARGAPRPKFQLCIGPRGGSPGLGVGALVLALVWDFKPVRSNININIYTIQEALLVETVNHVFFFYFYYDNNNNNNDY